MLERLYIITPSSSSPRPGNRSRINVRPPAMSALHPHDWWKGGSRACAGIVAHHAICCACAPRCCTVLQGYRSAEDGSGSVAWAGARGLDRRGAGRVSQSMRSKCMRTQLATTQTRSVQRGHPPTPRAPGNAHEGSQRAADRRDAANRCMDFGGRRRVGSTAKFETAMRTPNDRPQATRATQEALPHPPG